MAEFTVERTQVVGSTLDKAWAFYADPTNLQGITPPWLHFRIEEAPTALQQGSFLTYRLRLFGVPVHWLTEITTWHPPRSFTDVQRRGPYLLWEHTHRLTPVAGGTEIHDHVRYRVPGGRFVDLLVCHLLAAIFDYRAARTTALLGPAEHFADTA